MQRSAVIRNRYSTDFFGIVMPCLCMCSVRAGCNAKPRALGGIWKPSEKCDLIVGQDKNQIYHIQNRHIYVDILIYTHHMHPYVYKRDMYGKAYACVCVRAVVAIEHACNH